MPKKIEDAKFWLLVEFSILPQRESCNNEEQVLDSWVTILAKTEEGCMQSGLLCWLRTCKIRVRDLGSAKLKGARDLENIGPKRQGTDVPSGTRSRIHDHKWLLDTRNSCV